MTNDAVIENDALKKIRIRWDVTGMEFRKDDYKLYDFPKNENCETVYCNIEGVHWVDDYTIIAVSDKMKSKGS